MEHQPLRHLQEEYEDIAQRAADMLLRGFSDIERVILYGSTAKGMAGPDSDIDLMVTYRGTPSEVNDHEFRRRVIELLTTNKIPIGNHSKGQDNGGKIAVSTIAEEVYQHPDLYISPRNLDFLILLQNIGDTGRELKRSKGKLTHVLTFTRSLFN